MGKYLTLKTRNNIMTGQQIKKKVDLIYEHQFRLDEQLKNLRAICKHEKTEVCDYMWAPGHISPNTTICAYCGKVIVPQSVGNTFGLYCI